MSVRDDFYLSEAIKRWAELSFGHQLPPPDGSLVLEGFCQGSPSQPGEYVFWYDGRANSLGFSAVSKKTHLKLITAAKKGEIGDGVPLMADRGRDGKSWALAQRGKRNWLCLIFMMVRAYPSMMG
jgi:hypothetical protein